MASRCLKGKLTYISVSEEESMRYDSVLSVVKFVDRFGNVYSWVPKLVDLEAIIETRSKAIETNKVRKG
jgi:K+/H+ antiporter YhaU regulatory subunit KhtT